MTIRRTIIVAIIALAGGTIGGHRAEAAIVYPFSSDVTVTLNATVTIDIRLDSQNQVVNAVETSLIYDPAALEVISVTHADSLLTLWTEEPTVADPGKITLAGGRPDGTLAVGGRLASIAFRTLQLGQTTLAIQPSLTGVYLHDGYATPAEVTGRTLDLHVINKPSLLTQPTSPSHPVEGAWSNLRDVLLTWTPFKNAVISYSISRDPSVEPDKIVEENGGQAVFPGLEDGLWYIGFAERFPGQAWSDVFHREVRIDAHPPLPFELTYVQDPGTSSYIAFSVQDRESGIVRYTARVERSRWWTPWLIQTTEQAVSGPFVLVDFGHVAKVSVTAYDAAGNTQTATLNGPGRPDVRWVLLVVISSIVVLCIVLIELLRRPRKKTRKT